MADFHFRADAAFPINKIGFVLNSWNILNGCLGGFVHSYHGHKAPAKRTDIIGKHFEFFLLSMLVRLATMINIT